ncbi:MAG: hypothetical protein IKG22_12625, partial [Atopobiaceae bacterium]|nr:hypothetical protein [Atopobiaceae bacterium]
SYERMRKKLLEGHAISSMAHLGTRAFGAIGGEVVSTTATVFSAAPSDAEGAYFRLVDMGSEDEKREGLLEALANPVCGWFFGRSTADYEAIPGLPIAYWVSKPMVRAFELMPRLGRWIDIRLGMTTADNARFVRLWWEVPSSSRVMDAISLDDFQKHPKAKWASYNKGGEFRKWYGNDHYVVNWENDGYEIRHFADASGRIRSTVPNEDYYFKPSITWSKISSGAIAVRARQSGSLFDVAGASGFVNDEKLRICIMSFLNSSIALHALSFMSPTLNYEGGQIASLPLSFAGEDSRIADIAKGAVDIARTDWQCSETSCGFRRHPLL